MLEREEEEKEEALIGRVDVIRARIHVEEANAVSVSLYFSVRFVRWKSAFWNNTNYIFYWIYFYIHTLLINSTYTFTRLTRWFLRTSARPVQS